MNFDIDYFNVANANPSEVEKLQKAVDGSDNPLNYDLEYEFMDDSHKGFVLYTDNTSKLSQTDIDFVSELLGNNSTASWAGTPALSVNASY